MNKIFTKSLFFLALILGIAAATSCKEKPEEPKFGTLSAIFASDSFNVEPGGTISMPFTISGVDGATIKTEAKCDKATYTVNVKTNADNTGTVEFTAPAVSKGETVAITLTVTDAQNNRNANAKANVVIGASEDIVLALGADIKSILVKPNSTYELPVTITGVGAATLSDPTFKTTSGWNATFEWAADKLSGKVKLTAPATLPASFEMTMSISDNYGRSAELPVKLEVVEATPTEGAANSFIVKPGNTVTIKAVEGNSNTELNFNSASLVWQDAKSMVKSVSASSLDKIIVVQLNPGVSGNAVVAATLDGVIVWSWHLWVTDFDPNADPFVWTSKTSGKTYTYMDRNLGALGNGKYTQAAIGLLYQWGRKDPFAGADGVESSVAVFHWDINNERVREDKVLRPTYTDHVSTNLQLSIQNPTIFYYAPSSAWPVVDWLTDDAECQNHDLWGGVSHLKTRYDPCPEGWRVPEAGDPWGFRQEYKKDGKINDGGKYYPEYPWFIEYDDEYCIGFRYKQPNGKEYWWPFTGKLDCNSGVLSGVNAGANYHTATCKNTTVETELFAWGNPASETGLNRPYGNAVRCVKE